jgi:uncharacterized protein YegL
MSTPTMSFQVPYQDAIVHNPETDFAMNPEPRCACVLLLDVSASMSGEPLSALNASLQQFRGELLEESLAASRVEVGIVTFGPVAIQQEFVSASNWVPPHLTAQADTPMGAAIEQAISLLESRKSDYRSAGLKYFRPWIILITDGAPTDSWQMAAQRVRQGEEAKNFAFFALGVQNADMHTLRQISSREPMKLQGLKFAEFFTWLSSSLQSVSQSVPGTQVALPPPDGWASV